MSDKCELRYANGLPVQHCELDECIFWRVAEHLGVDGNADGCAIQYYQLLGDEDVARWLLSVKERLEQTARPDKEDSSDG
jgi:hypothetical protein